MVVDVAATGWSVAVVSSRESIHTLKLTVTAVLNALASTPTSIDVLVNGNRELAVQMAAEISEARPANSCPISIRIWCLPLADKAHAWNEYLHKIWQSCDIAYFVDGYARVTPDSLLLLNEALNNRPDAWAASGVPTVGRTARSLRREMIQEGGGHGTLHALRGEVCFKLRQRGFRIPLGLYRVDGLVFALLAFALDPAVNRWDTTRTVVHPKATWDFRPLVWWRLSDLRAYLRRMLRQAQGDLENRAIREHLAVQKRSPESLPETCSDLVLSWSNAFPGEFRRMVLRNPLRLLAMIRLCRPRDWSRADLSPELLAHVAFGGTDPEPVSARNEHRSA